MSDVAQLAGVSRTTVSLILNARDTRIPKRTKDRVEAAAKELRFRPSVIAQQLRTAQSRLIGLVTDEIATGPFGGGLIAGAQSAANEAGYTLAIINTGREGELDVDLNVLEDRGVDALIFATVMTRAISIPEIPNLDRQPVLLNCFTRSRSFLSVLPDDCGGQEKATALALENNHRRIAFIGGAKGTWPMTERIRGYKQALGKAAVAYDPSIVRFGGWHADTGYQLTNEVLSLPDRPTALLCGNDRIALGAIEAVKERGLSIPLDVSIIGYDNHHEIVEYTRPPLTSIQLPYVEMGATAVRALLDPQHSRNRVLVECSPVLRQSHARAS